MKTTSSRRPRRPLPVASTIAAAVALTVLGAGQAQSDTTRQSDTRSGVAAFLQPAPESGRSRGGCLPGGICGAVKNLSGATIQVTRSWCAQSSGPCGSKDVENLAHGRTTKQGVDFDGFKLSRHLKVAYDGPFGVDTRCKGPGWHKIGTDIVARVSNRSC